MHHGKHGKQGFEDDKKEGRRLRERPEYALINHHYTHIDDQLTNQHYSHIDDQLINQHYTFIDDQRADPRRLHHRHPSPFLDNLP